MNITNRDYFTFNVDNSALIIGQTGTGKSEMVHKLIDMYQSAQSPDEVKFVLFDLKQVEFNDTNKDYLYFDVIYDADIGLGRLDELAELSIKRKDNNITKPLLFIYIEECDMAAVDQKRFDEAVIVINTNAKKAGMKLVYSTSRPAPDVVSKELIASFDLIMTSQLASEADAKHLGVPYRKNTKPYSFLVTPHSDIYNSDGKNH